MRKGSKSSQLNAGGQALRGNTLLCYGFPLLFCTDRKIIESVGSSWHSKVQESNKPDFSTLDSQAMQ